MPSFFHLLPTLSAAAFGLSEQPRSGHFRYEHLVWYVGWHSNRSRGARKAKAPAPACESATEPISEFVQRTKQAWARLIRKVYEADPLECPKCKGPMRVIALIDAQVVVRESLVHLGRRQPEARAHRPCCLRPGPRTRTSR